MSTDTVCRVCLANNMNLYCVGNDLQNVYERIAREKYNKVGYPVHMCYICLTVLQKCHRFMETARDTNNMLKQWYKQQNEMREARPLYTYIISKTELLSTVDEDMTLQYGIKLEEVESEQEEGQQEYAECNTDMETKDIDEQTDNSELLVDTPNDDSLDVDTDECNNDRQTDPLFDDKIYIEVSKSLVPNFDGHTNSTKPLHQSPEISVETGANSETCNNNTLLNSTPYQLDNVRDRSIKTEPMFDKKYDTKREGAKLRKIVKREVIQNKNKQLARITKKNIKTSHKMGLNTSLNEIKPSKNKTTVKGHLTRNSDEKTFERDICNYKCKLKHSQKIHKKTHTGAKLFLCDICSYHSAKRTDLLRHMRTHTGEKPFACHICGYKCVTNFDLARHMRTHTGEKPYSCDVCHYKTAQKGALIIHMRTHTGEKPYSCDVCDYKSSYSSSLASHMKTHTGDKPHSCDICDYRCSKRNSLVNHMKTHTGDKPFSCDNCNYKCTQKYSLKIHKENQSCEKILACNNCDYTCARQGDLIQHMRTHTGEKLFFCNICTYNCLKKALLVSHLKTHTGEKPYSCNLCDHKFAQNGGLMRHMRIHTGEKPYSCNICDFKTSHTSCLKRHLKKVHAC